jgi:hypothetical protein
MTVRLCKSVTGAAAESAGTEAVHIGVVPFIAGERSCEGVQLRQAPLIMGAAIATQTINIAVATIGAAEFIVVALS